MHPKQNQKQIIHESNILCMLQTGRKKTLKVLKAIKSNFMDVIGEKLAMSIRWRKLTISFWKKLFSWVSSLT